MFHTFLIRILFLALIWTARAGEDSLKPPLGGPCFEACQWTLRPVRFTDGAGMSPVPKVRSCNSRLALTSLYLCNRVYCTDDERTAGLEFLNSTCRKSQGTAIPPFELLVGNYTEDDVARVRRLRQDEWEEAAAAFPEAVIASDEFFGLAYNTLYSWSYVYNRHILYGFAMFVFWGIVIAIGLLNRAVLAISHFMAYHPEGWKSAPHDELGEFGSPIANGTQPRPFRPSAWLKRYVTLPATFGYRSSQPFGWYTVPPRIQSFTILAFVVMNIVFCVHGYRVFPGNLYFPKVFTQGWRYVSDRTGIISFANFPLIWLFGMRNNLLMWLTGWDFGTFNNFHRWVARVATVQAVVHSVGYTVLVIDRGGWDLFAGYWKVTWWTTGELATIFMCLLLPLSLYWMRRNVYEAFLIIHVVFSVIILATMWGHVSVFGARYYQIVWICVSIWALDRALRVLRTLSFNIKFWNSKAKATYDPDANIVRLSIPYSSSLYRPRPGTFYYLHLLDDVRFWESHPFTVSSIRAPRPSDTEMGVRRSYDETGEETSLLSSSGKDSSTYPAEPTMNFLIRPYDSSTRRLAERATAASSWPEPEPASLRVIVEGPYGHTQPFHRFDSLLFVVGGSGVVVPLSYMEALLATAASTTTATRRRRLRRQRRVRIVWAVREAAFASSVLREELGRLLHSRDVDGHAPLSLDVYATGGEGMMEEEGSSPPPPPPPPPPSSWLAEDLLPLPKGFRVLHGRPDVRDEVQDAVRELGDRERLAVVACGPARMADDARKAVVDMLGRGAPSSSSVEYFEESFNW